MMEGVRRRVVRVAQRYSSRVGLDLPYFIGGGVWLSVGQAFNVLCLFVLSLLFANVLDKDVYGQYTFVMSVFALAASFALPGMNSAVNAAVSRGFEGTYAAAVRVTIKYGLLGVVFLLCFALYGVFVDSDRGVVIFLLLALLFIPHNVALYYIPFLQARRSFRVDAVLRAVYSVVFLIVVSIAIFSGVSTTIILAAVVSQLVLNGAFSIIFVRPKNAAVDEDALRFGKRSSLGVAFAEGAGRIDNLVLAFFLGFDELAIYAIVTLVPNQLKALLNTYTPLVLPKLARTPLTYPEFKRHFARVLAVSALLVVLYAVAAPILFPIFYNKYSEYVVLSVVYNISFLSFPSALIQQQLIARHKDGYVNVLNVSSNALLIIGSIVLIYFFGLVGAVVNRMLYRFFVMGFGWYLNHHYYTHGKK